MTILYIVCFCCYILFSRVPDYFDGDFTKGIVSKAIFSVKDKHPILTVDYVAGNEKFRYITDEWFLTSHKQGDVVTMIYNPSDPKIASVYAIIGYWIKWNELFFTAIGFVILFIIAVIITGRNERL